MSNLLKQLLFLMIKRRELYRIGRSIYQKSRGDVANDMTSNGEMLIQDCVLDACTNGSLVGQRPVFFDVGANIGDWSSALLNKLSSQRKDEKADLYIFEPVPSTFEFLKNRLGSQNRIVHYEQVALSSESGESFIYVSAANAGTNTLHASNSHDEQTKTPIFTFTASEFCKNHDIKNIHLLKCDTEGHDMEVIRGALPMLADGNISVLQFEYNHRWIYSRNFLRDAFMAIEKLPYKLVMLQPEQLWVFDEWHPELERFFEGNYALIHVDALDWFPTKQVTWDRYNTMCVEQR